MRAGSGVLSAINHLTIDNLGSRCTAGSVDRFERLEPIEAIRAEQLQQLLLRRAELAQGAQLLESLDIRVNMAMRHLHGMVRLNRVSTIECHCNEATVIFALGI